MRRSAYSPPLLPFCFKQIIGQGGSADGTVLPAPWQYRGMEPLLSLHPIWQVSSLMMPFESAKCASLRLLTTPSPLLLQTNHRTGGQRGWITTASDMAVQRHGGRQSLRSPSMHRCNSPPLELTMRPNIHKIKVDNNESTSPNSPVLYYLF